MWEKSWRLNKDCNILSPSSSVFSSISFSFFLGCSTRGPDGPALCWVWFLLPRTVTNWLQLTELPVAPVCIIVWRPPASCARRICTQFNPSTVKVILWYFRPDTPVPWSTAGSEVNMLHVVLIELFCLAIRRDSASLLRFPYSQPFPSILAWDLACLSLDMPIQLFFFPSMFSGYFCSVDACDILLLLLLLLFVVVVVVIALVVFHISINWWSLTV